MGGNDCNLFLEPQQDRKEVESYVSRRICQACAGGAAGAVRILGNFEGPQGSLVQERMGLCTTHHKVRTPGANRKVTRTQGGKSPRPQRSLAESVAKAEEDQKQEAVCGC